MQNLENKIEAHHRNLDDVLSEQKYTVDYFQREYSWQTKHIEQLITDLTSTFLNEYQPGDIREKGDTYNNYFLGPFVVSQRDGRRSIIDGQQRLTSITLFLIYLNNLKEELGFKDQIKSLIYSEKRGLKSFNITVEERLPCLDALFHTGQYTPLETDDDSTKNMAERYQDIEDAFPEELKNEAFPFFIDWLRYNVIMVEIIAYSDENAYTIFETMNDRGMNLSSTEMLKGYILSRFGDVKKRDTANTLWKKSVQTLREFDEDEDQRFFQSWLRGQYAETIRPGKAGSQNEDFEKIGTRFHSWVRDNLSKIGLSANNSAQFDKFINIDFQFFLRTYLMILKAEAELQTGLEHVFYVKRWGIAPTLSYPLMLAPLNVDDDENTVREKISIVARYIETFVVKRSVNFKKFSASSIRYTMYTLAKEIRNKSPEELRQILSKRLREMDRGFSGFAKFKLHGQNYRFIKFLLSRMTAFIEQRSGMNTTFVTYYEPSQGKPFEVEHIWANKYSRFTDEFDQQHEFEAHRNSLGDLLLLPKGTNQSYGKKPYADKSVHYIKENLLAQSLCDLTYKNNPNFLNAINSLGLPFKSHTEFRKKDVDERQQLYQNICEIIWNDELA